MKRKLFHLFLLIMFSLSVSAQNSSNQSYSGNVPPDSISIELPGTIKSKLNDIITVQYTEAANLPAKNLKCTLSKHSDSVVFGFKTTGWLDIAEVHVISCEKGILKLKMISEKSQITVNDEKVDHFKVGNEVKITWKEPGK